MNKMLDRVLKECFQYTKTGSVASYIPELAKANPEKFGICIASNDSNIYFAGDYKHDFTMQSIVKVIILLMALRDKGEDHVRSVVGVEATGKPFDAFNYSDQALKCEHINPMINTGAIALCTLIDGETSDEKFSRLLDFTRKIANNPEMDIDEKVYLSEKATGNKNRALAYMLKAYGLITDDVEDVLDVYFKACSIKANCKDLARIALVFANRGVDPETNEQLFDKKYARDINAILMTCGMYDGSGEHALKVGVPAKSGVGGGIMAIVPGKMGIAVYSASLDSKGNSCAGIKALEILSNELDISIF